MDYKSGGGSAGGASAGSGRMMHPFSIGLIIGFVLGMGVAFGFALYVNRSESPFLEKELPGTLKELRPMEAAKAARAPSSRSSSADTAPKPKFDFYEILPGKQEAMPSKPAGDVIVNERVFVQAGSFQNSADADNLKARLALAGIEAQIKTAHLPDNKTWHRVRLGPYESAEEAQAVQSTLEGMEIQANLIRSRE